MPTTIILSPGYDNSCERHWQSHLERKFQNIIRVQQKNWQNPERQFWLDTLAKTIESVTGKVLLIGHSCGCNSITQLVELNTFDAEKITAAILVAPADIDAPNAFSPIHVQRPMNLTVMPFPSTVICSDNDEHASLERSQYFTKKWGSELIELTNAGHINSDTGYGEWPMIETLIDTIMDEPLIPKE